MTNWVDELLVAPSSSFSIRVEGIRAAYNAQQHTTFIDRGEDFFLALSEVVDNDNFLELQNFLIKENVPLNAVIAPHASTLLLIALEQMAFKNAKSLIEAGAPVNYIDDTHQTALSVLIKHQHTELLPMLLEQKADINLLDKQNRHILYSLQELLGDRKIDFIKQIIDSGFDKRLLAVHDMLTGQSYFAQCMNGYMDFLAPHYNEHILAVPQYIFQHSTPKELNMLEFHIKSCLENKHFQFKENCAEKLLSLIGEEKIVQEKENLKFHIAHNSLQNTPKLHKI